MAKWWRNVEFRPLRLLAFLAIQLAIAYFADERPSWFWATTAIVCGSIVALVRKPEEQE